MAAKGRLRLLEAERRMKEESERANFEREETLIQQKLHDHKTRRALLARRPSVRIRSMKLRAKTAEQSLRVRMEAAAQAQLFKEEEVRLERVKKANADSFNTELLYKRFESRFRYWAMNHSEFSGAVPEPQVVIAELAKAVKLLNARNRLALHADHAVASAVAVWENIGHASRILTLKEKLQLTTDIEKAVKCVAERVVKTTAADKLVRALFSQINFAIESSKVRQQVEQKQRVLVEAEKSFLETEQLVKTQSMDHSEELERLTREMRKCAKVVEDNAAKMISVTAVQQLSDKEREGKRREKVLELQRVEEERARLEEEQIRIAEERRRYAERQEEVVGGKIGVLFLSEEEERARGEALERAKALEEERRRLTVELEQYRAEVERLRATHEEETRRLQGKKMELATEALARKEESELLRIAAEAAVRRAEGDAKALAETVDEARRFDAELGRLAVEAERSKREFEVRRAEAELMRKQEEARRRAIEAKEEEARRKALEAKEEEARRKALEAKEEEARRKALEAEEEEARRKAIEAKEEEARRKALEAKEEEARRKALEPSF